MFVCCSIRAQEDRANAERDWADAREDLIEAQVENKDLHASQCELEGVL